MACGAAAATQNPRNIAMLTVASANKTVAVTS
jgi:hypothetical protein